MSDARKLTVYFGERARAGGRFLSDALAGVFARHRLPTSIELRGIEGFGAGSVLRTDRLLTLSEDLPMVAIAVGGRAPVEAALEDVRALPSFGGLVTLERARLLDGAEAAAAARADHAAARLSVFVGRHERAGSVPAHVAVIDLLRAHGVDGATALLGVDGTVRGERRRARFAARNAAVPMLVLAVGDAAAIGGALGDLRAVLADPLVTLERLQVCQRDGVVLSRPEEAEAPEGWWRKLMIYTSERAGDGDGPLHRAIVAALRHAGAPGATTVRGAWGYHGDRAPHGDRFWQLRRHVPVVTTVLDRPERIGTWFDVAREAGGGAGLITCEVVPEAFSPRAGARGAGRPPTTPR
jgi:PII-like signaling protein